MLEAYNIKQEEIKEKSLKRESQENEKTIKLKSHQKDKHLGCPTLVKYSGLFLKWTKEELQLMDQRTRIYQEKRSGLASIEDSVDTLIRRLEDYIKKSKERLITATKSNKNNKKINGITTTRKKKKWE